MNIGKMDRRIDLYRIDTLNSPEGEPVPTRSKVARLWAGMRAVSSTEKRLANRIVAEADIVFTIRYRSYLNLDASYQIDCEGQTYQINGQPQESGRHCILFVPCKLVGK